MKKILLTLSLTALLLFTAGCSCPFSDKTADSKPQMNTAAASAAEAAPDFSYKELGSGKTMRLSDLKGKPVFINFWATWCPPCVKELPHIQAKYEQYKDKINFVAISLDGEQDAPAQFIPAKGYTFPVGYGNEREISRAYNVEAIPMSFIIDTNGVVKAKIMGSMDEAALESFIQKGL